MQLNTTSRFTTSGYPLGTQPVRHQSATSEIASVRFGNKASLESIQDPEFPANAAFSAQINSVLKNGGFGGVIDALARNGWKLHLLNYNPVQANHRRPNDSYVGIEKRLAQRKPEKLIIMNEAQLKDVHGRIPPYMVWPRVAAAIDQGFGEKKSRWNPLAQPVPISASKEYMAAFNADMEKLYQKLDSTIEAKQNEVENTRDTKTDIHKLTSGMKALDKRTPEGVFNEELSNILQYGADNLPVTLFENIRLFLVKKLMQIEI